VRSKVRRDDLVTAAEIVLRLNLTLEEAYQLTQQSRFPEPVARIGSSEAWSWTQIESLNRERAKEHWIAEALLLVPAGGMLQTMFRSNLQNSLTNALSSKSEIPDAPVAEYVKLAMEGFGGVPRFDLTLLNLDWPEY
jgi:hypothetical protein